MTCAHPCLAGTRTEEEIAVSLEITRCWKQFVVSLASEVQGGQEHNLDVTRRRGMHRRILASIFFQATFGSERKRSKPAMAAT